MEVNNLLSEFQNKICKEVSLYTEGVNRFVVHTPFMFEDGDHLVILLKKNKKNWYFTDEGHTLMHVSYQDIDIERGTRRKLIESVLESYGIDDHSGELKLVIKGNSFGDSLFSYIQGLIKITDVSFISKERVRSAFLEEFKALLVNSIPEDRRKFDYTDPKVDPDKKYVVDCRVNGQKRPLFFFAINNDSRCRDATITCLHYENHGLSFAPAAIFEEQESVNRKVLARFSDVCEKQFSSIHSAEERLAIYLKTYLN